MPWSRAGVPAFAFLILLAACSSLPQPTPPEVAPTLTTSPASTQVATPSQSISPTVEARTFVCVGPPLPPGETPQPVPNPTLIDETGLVEACAQTDVVEPLHGAISLTNPFEPSAIEVMWAATYCDSSIIFRFSRSPAGYQLTGDPPEDCDVLGAPLPVYIRFTVPMNADDVEATLIGVTARELYAPIDSVELSDNHRRIHIDFVGAKEYVEGDRCSAEYAAETEVQNDVLGVGVFISRTGTTAFPRNRVSIGCDSLGYVRELEWKLDQPFTGSQWRDLRGGGAYDFGEGPGSE